MFVSINNVGAVGNNTFNHHLYEPIFADAIQRYNDALNCSGIPALPAVWFHKWAEQLKNISREQWRDQEAVSMVQQFSFRWHAHECTWTPQLSLPFTACYACFGIFSHTVVYVVLKHKQFAGASFAILRMLSVFSIIETLTEVLTLHYIFLSKPKNRQRQKFDILRQRRQ